MIQVKLEEESWAEEMDLWPVSPLAVSRSISLELTIDLRSRGLAFRFHDYLIM